MLMELVADKMLSAARKWWGEAWCNGFLFSSGEVNVSHPSDSLANSMAATYKTAHGAHPLLKSNEYFILMICFFNRMLFTYLHCATFTIVVCVICYKVKYNIPLGWLRWRGTRVCPGSAGTRRSAWSPWTPWQRAGSGQVVTLSFIYNVSPDLSNRRLSVWGM